MSEIIAFLIGFTLGFVSGLLVYRKNGKRMADLEAELAKLKS